MSSKDLSPYQNLPDLRSLENPRRNEVKMKNHSLNKKFRTLKKPKLAISYSSKQFPQFKKIYE